MWSREVKTGFSPSAFLRAFGDKEGFCFLDNCATASPNRFSYIGINPRFSVYQAGDRSFFNRAGDVLEIGPNILAFLKDFLRENKRPKGPFPFSGGFMGYMTYDFGWLLDKFRPALSKNKILGLPLAKFSYYDEIFVIDSKENRLFFVSAQKDADERPYLKALKEKPAKSTGAGFIRPRSSLSKKRYMDAVKKAKEYISRGDIYQANISQRFTCPFSVDPVDFYLKLRAISPAPFGAFLKDTGAAIVCNSPERFLLKTGKNLETRPIKGTRKRSKNRRTDNALIKELSNSKKDAAEHIMIVDLERNDLGRVCEIGSIYVKKLMAIESYANVHHMVSTVSGRLKKDRDIIDCIYGCFPGGSITGAPKLRSMEIIRELEPVDRSIYCGSIGYIDDSGDADLNIAIRTGIITNGRLYFYAGGGIVADSDPDAEHEETIIKARSFLAAMGIAEVSY